ncbi:NAD(P)-dependent oxidoreductase [Flavobacterium microcysteis]|uniref:SDR family oxidoreductase n=1 Tax=Flavobacterium microcysteis TaxID=2596891 RepID=A0A501QBE1_9FLAO|nr:NAD(P)-binding oxidoreductase [Flavobacterium microcysteis]TPD69738.1 SDR family oxidoreductase [Flavobacterium microcysteis]
MTTLVVGASGATGKLLVEQLLKSGQSVKAIVRFSSSIPETWKSNDRLTIIKVDAIETISIDEMMAYLKDCQSVASCLGHNLSFKGIYGKPRRLVADMVELLCQAIIKNAPEKPLRLVLMNTAGNSNRDLNERISIGQKIVIGLLRLLLPPHVDNEKATDYLRIKIGQKNPFVEWAAVRPDSLIDIENVTAYSAHTSPTRSALFDSGKVSRSNVAHFMSQLLLDDKAWKKWKGQMPVLYNDAIEEK